MWDVKGLEYRSNSAQLSCMRRNDVDGEQNVPQDSHEPSGHITA
jgi:hypothetical protein